MPTPSAVPRSPEPHAPGTDAGTDTGPGRTAADRQDAPAPRPARSVGATLLPPGLALAALLAAVITTTGSAARRVVYPADPPPAHTGGFGEPTCHACHFEAEPNQPGGRLDLTGLPESYEPGASYTLTLVLTRPGQQAAGFQLAARVASGPRAGAQAGTLQTLDERTQNTTAGEKRVQYLHHTEKGTALLSPDTARWTFRWTAPPDSAAPAGGDTVVFHIVANAADGDLSPFGDLIYTTTRKISRRTPDPSP